MLSPSKIIPHVDISTPQVLTCPHLCHPPSSLQAYTANPHKHAAGQPVGFTQCHWCPKPPNPVLEGLSLGLTDPAPIVHVGQWTQVRQTSPPGYSPPWGSPAQLSLSTQAKGPRSGRSPPGPPHGSPHIWIRGPRSGDLVSTRPSPGLTGLAVTMHVFVAFKNQLLIEKLKIAVIKHKNLIV